ncbi:MAG TPA: methyltransferase domain-containing protein, partial [Pyrinomonadaceae bacterium]|nr:methyltransferase domain-containing protein [Pyrinomonadaceae bacterium]
MPKLLNLGCGPRFRPGPDWVNVDFTSAHPAVLAHDLRRGVPFPEGTFDAVYHSHVLEHFSPRDAEPFVRECFRVLRPGGVLRVAVPDLEQICRLYLGALEGLGEGREGARAEHEWLLLELYDQAVRTRPGGEMAEHLRRLDPAAREFVVARAGNVVREII